MARSAFSVTVDVTKIDGLVDRLSALGPQEFAEAAMVAVNTVAQDVYDLVVPRMVRTLNLSEQYVGQRMQLRFATDPSNVRAQIIAVGSKPSMTQLARYDARQLVRAASNPKAKGSPRHGIAKGMKSAGVSVEVLRGSVQKMPGAFLVELKNGNGWGVATRRDGGKGAYRVRYGPSVYQMFKYTAEQAVDESSDMLAESLVREAERMLQNNLNTNK